MAATLKTYDVVCPDPDCAEEFEVERDPAELLSGDGDLIECPACLEEWEWDYDQESDTLDLTGEDFEDGDITSEMDLTGEDDDED